jgi:transcriptional regulator with XRE-family HTH domain
VTYVPPERAKQFAIKPEDGWISHGWLLFEAWRTGAGRNYESTAEALSLAQGNITGWKKGRIPSLAHAKRIEALAGVDPQAWTWWLREDGANPNTEPPPSEKRPRGPRVRGTTHEELWRTLDEIDDELEDNELSGTARASLLGRKASTLDRISRLEERQKLEDHPDFEAFSEDALRALEATLRHFGVEPDGARTVFADHLERLEAERQRRAA